MNRCPLKHDGPRSSRRAMPALLPLLALAAMVTNACEDSVRPGIINVTVSTSGLNTPSSYWIDVTSITGGASGLSGLNQTQSFSVVSDEAGAPEYTISLRMVDGLGDDNAPFPNCTVAVDATAGTVGTREVRGIRVQSELDVEISFEVSCT